MQRSYKIIRMTSAAQDKTKPDRKCKRLKIGNGANYDRSTN
jgi:hypothetical protein